MIVEVLVGGLDFLSLQIDIVEGVQLLTVAGIHVLDELEGVAKVLETCGAYQCFEVGIG